MYSTTYADGDAYERATLRDRRVIATFANSGVRECPVEAGDASVVATPEPNERARRTEILRACFGDIEHLQSLVVEGFEDDIDWTRWERRGSRRVRVAGPIVAHDGW
jgi:hypothetical protein